MPPRLRLRSLAQLADLQLQVQRTTSKSRYTCGWCQYYATAVATTTPAASDAQMQSSMRPSSLSQSHSPVQPPSHRSPAYRKSQLLRSYVSLLQTTPLIVLFQHSNLKAVEWVGIRRELRTALRKVDEQLARQGSTRPEDLIAEHVKFEVIKTNIFEPALRVAEYFNPGAVTPRSIGGLAGASEKEDPAFTHALSEAAYRVASEHKGEHPLTPVLAGAVAILTFPVVSPVHLKAAFSILSPQAPTFPAPTRRAAPMYYDPPVQDGLKKLMVLGARIDGQVFDLEGTKWVGSIDGGIDGLRAQLVGLLQGFGVGLTSTLESASRSLWFTMESRRTMLEDEEKPKDENQQ